MEFRLNSSISSIAINSLFVFDFNVVRNLFNSIGRLNLIEFFGYSDK